MTKSHNKLYLQLNTVDVLEASVGEHEALAGVVESEREPIRDVARVGVGEEGDGVMRDTVLDPIRRVPRDSFDVDDSVRRLLHRPQQVGHLRY